MNSMGAKGTLQYAKPILLIESPEAASPTVKEAMDELGMTRRVVHVHNVDKALERLTAGQALEPAVIVFVGLIRIRKYFCAPVKIG